MKKIVQCFSFYSCLCQKSIQQIGLEYGLFYQIVKIKWTIIGETNTASKNKNKTKESIFEFVG